MLQRAKISMHKAEPEDTSRLGGLMERAGFRKDDAYFTRCFEAQDRGERQVFIVQIEGQDCGHVILNWKPKYKYFQSHNIPEIQDLHILHDYRRRGIARAVIEYCEDAAKQGGHDEMGIAVGLDSSYGAAQRLYVRMGYIPDGYGLTYDRVSVSYAEFRPVDDNLCLMLTKSLVEKGI